MKKMLFVFIAGMVALSAHGMDENSIDGIRESQFDRQKVRCTLGGMAALGAVGVSGGSDFACIVSTSLLTAGALFALSHNYHKTKITRIYDGKTHPSIILEGDKQEVDDIINDLRAKIVERKSAIKEGPEKKIVDASEDSLS